MKLKTATVIFPLLLLLSNTIYVFIEFSRKSKQTIENFTTQNTLVLKTGDIYTLSTQLGYLKQNNNNIECISAKKHGVFFFGNRNVGCPSKFFTADQLIDLTMEGGVEINIQFSRITETLLSAFIFFLSQLMVLFTLRRYGVDAEREKQENIRKIEGLKHAKNAAIALTSQMLSHDVRRPFSMIQSLLSILEAAKTEAHIRELIKKFSPEVKKSIVSVNGMISDIMEVGTTSKPITSPVAIDEILLLALTESFQFRSQCDIEFLYGLDHLHKVNVDKTKMTRVLTNVLVNAREEMKNSGRIWFNSCEITSGPSNFTELTIGNSNSYIPDGKIKNLFEAFYTEGKAGGTGLGLAIAKKIVVSHGGNIRAKSTIGVGVEFIITLPNSKHLAPAKAGFLPGSAQTLQSLLPGLVGGSGKNHLKY